MGDGNKERSFGDIVRRYFNYDGLGFNFTTEAIQSSALEIGRIYNDFTTDRWDKLREEDKHPLIKLLVGEITAEKARMENSGEYKKELIDKGFERVMHGMGQINNMTLQAERILAPMVMVETKAEAPIDRSNEQIKIVLDDFEKKIEKIIQQQEFSSEKKSLNGNVTYLGKVGSNSIDSFACFTPQLISDKLLEFTKLKVKNGMSKEKPAIDAANLGNIAPILPRDSCYRHAPWDGGSQAR